MTTEELKQQILALLKDAGYATLGDAKKSAELVANYAADRATSLAQSYGQPGWDEAFKAARQSTLIFAGISLVATADAADVRAMAILETSLRIGAMFLATLA